MIGRHLSKFWIYFQTGHRQYLAWILTFFNFITLQYTLIINRFFPEIELSIILFSIIFLITYFPLSYLIGWISYNHGPTHEEPALSPYNQDFTRASLLEAHAIKEFIQGNTETAINHLNKSIKIRENWIR